MNSEEKPSVRVWVRNVLTTVYAADLRLEIGTVYHAPILGLSSIDLFPVSDRFDPDITFFIQKIDNPVHADAQAPRR